VAGAIRRLAIRGAPLIGVAAGYGVALDLEREARTREVGKIAARGMLQPDLREALNRACELLRAARPTAVNPSRAIDRVRAAALGAVTGDEAAVALSEAQAIHAEEEAASGALGRAGAELFTGCRRILTHCNTGALAAPGTGTALAVVTELAARGELDGVIATESRPLLQGSRLTVYELAKLGIPHELVVDAAAPGLIAAGAVDAVIVGCDRVAANGDVANKVGTYGLALAARAAGIPFVVAGPTSTIDAACSSAAQIEIEERDPEEVRSARGRALTLPGTRCRNPAFDLTPAALVSALATERGVAQPVNAATIRGLLPA